MMPYGFNLSLKIVIQQFINKGHDTEQRKRASLYTVENKMNKIVFFFHKMRCCFVNTMKNNCQNSAIFYIPNDG